MQLTDRDISVLELLLTFGYLITSQIRSVLFPNDKDGSVTRERLRKLEAAGLVHRRRAEVANPLTSNTIPVWIITEKGICLLSLRKNDATILNQRPPCTRSWQNFTHYVAVADLLLKAKQSIAAQTRVQLGDMFFEHTLVNAAADDAAHRYKLYTVLAETPKRLICAPDASFELKVAAYRRPYYIELERGTDTPARVAAKKTPGYHGLFVSKQFKRHYPDANDFRVLCVAPTSSWRDSLRKAVRDKPGADLWLFMALDEIKPDTFLHGNIAYTCTEGPRPFVRPEAPPQQG